MKRITFVGLALGLFWAQAIAGGGLDGFLSNVNVQARADLPGFSATVSAQFGVPVPQVQAILTRVDTPRMIGWLSGAARPAHTLASVRSSCGAFGVDRAAGAGQPVHPGEREPLLAWCGGGADRSYIEAGEVSIHRTGGHRRAPSTSGPVSPRGVRRLLARWG